MPDVPDLVRVSVVAPIGNSDHSSLSAIILMAQAVPNLCVSRKVFLKHQVNWNTVCGAVQDLPWHNILSTDIPVAVLNEHLLLLVGRFVPTKIIRVSNKDKPWFDDQCRQQENSTKCKKNKYFIIKSNPCEGKKNSMYILEFEQEKATTRCKVMLKS